MSENEKKVPKRRFREFGNAEEWEQRKLKDVSTYSNGGSFENDVQEKGRYELITLKSVDMDGNLVHSGRYVDIEVPTLTKGTLVMILSEQSPGLLGMTAQIPVDNTYILNQRVAEIRPDESVESYFLSMAINKNQPYFSRCGAGTKVQNISKSNVENYEFLCPPLQEQQKIGQFFTTINKSIILHQRKLEKVKTLKKAYLTEMFPAKGERKPKLRFAGFTDDWEQRKIKEVCSISTGKSNTQDRIDDGIYPFYVRSPIIEHSNRYLYDEEAVLTVGDGVGTGKVFHYVNGKYDLHQRVYRMFDFINGTSGKYFYYYFSNHFYDRVMSMTAKTSVDSVRFEMISEMDIMLPTEKEQTVITDFFDKLNNIITLHQRKLEKLQNIKKAYLNEMFI